MVWVWDAPVNGWEMVIGVLLTLVTTVISVVIGVRFALAGERRAAEAQKLRDDHDRARAIVGRAAERVPSALISGWFGGLTPGGLAAQWDPDPIGVLLDDLRASLPSSMMSVHRWARDVVDPHLIEMKAQRQDVSEMDLRQATMAIEKRLQMAFRDFGDGTVDVTFFSTSD